MLGLRVLVMRPRGGRREGGGRLGGGHLRLISRASAVGRTEAAPRGGAGATRRRWRDGPRAPASSSCAATLSVRNRASAALCGGADVRVPRSAERGGASGCAAELNRLLVERGDDEGDWGAARRARRSLRRLRQRAGRLAVVVICLFMVVGDGTRQLQHEGEAETAAAWSVAHTGQADPPPTGRSRPPPAPPSCSR